MLINEYWKGRNFSMIVDSEDGDHGAGGRVREVGGIRMHESDSTDSVVARGNTDSGGQPALQNRGPRKDQDASLTRR